MKEKRDMRKFGYYTVKPDETMDIFVHSLEVDAEIIAELNKVVSVIFDLQPIVFAFDVVERNYNEFIDMLEYCMSHMNTLTPTVIAPVPIIMDTMIAVSQKTTNFLSSTSAFLAHTDKQLQKIHGKDSNEWCTWDGKRKALHANSFAYRFLYELRNFAQHRDLPFSTLNFSGERSSEDAPLVFKIGAFIVTEGLLSSGYDWKKLKVQIEQQPHIFDLLPLMSEYLYSLRHLFLEGIKLQMERLVLCSHYFEAFSRTLNIPASAVPVMFLGAPTSEGVPPSRFEVIPMEQYSYLLRKLEQYVKGQQDAY